MSDQKENKSAAPADSAARSGVSELKGISIVGKVVGLIVMLWLISVSYYAFAFFALGMLPAVVSMIIDRGTGRFASKTVTACNFIGILPYLFDIGMTYERSLASKQLMAQPITWLVIYGASAVGWMLIWILPQITLVIFTMRADMKKTTLIEEQARLLDEWGEEVRTGSRRNR
ncbi:MAG: hypothetical protein K0R98_1497 [Rickettsiaceae bacterium]|jgi:hypothetical protein|nr:hypothetical protein [Rickettsiaceae bacterium]